MQRLTGVKELKNNKKKALLKICRGVERLGGFQMKVLCAACRLNRPSLSHTAVPVLLIRPNNHFNSISGEQQPPRQHSQERRVHPSIHPYMRAHAYRGLNN